MLLAACARVPSLDVSDDVDGAWPPGRFVRVDLDHEGGGRDYLVYVPESRPEGPAPLLRVLHGFGGTPEGLEPLTGFSEIAETSGFVLVYPRGLDRRWRDQMGEREARRVEVEGMLGEAPDAVDDVGFLRAVVQDVARRRSIDEERVFVAGMSNGAGMSQRLACEASDVFSGVGLVVGGNVGSAIEDCHPDQPVSVVAYHGTDDPLVLYEGGEARVLRHVIPSVPVDDLAGFWAEANGCAPTPAERQLEEVSTDDYSTVVRRTWSGCHDDVRVRFHRIDGAGHTWPGGPQYAPRLLIGATNHDVEASAGIWQALSGT
jgi:polyhydroxybutyrate depolymerase